VGCARAGLALSKFAAMLASPQRFGNERIGEKEPRFHHVVDPQQDFQIFGR
jgi:hypothetical protein